ncbi:PGF-pre-PGF domain-containing protein [Methanosarcina sp. Mfa9]|uniref:PGF-pre-PGF domain-containing protein n=1 Tax=Methanosarcina sp. Mfa9 TaxID=3439063 RepID=UPI003F856F55
MKNTRFETPEKGRELQTSIDEAEKTPSTPETYNSENYFIVQFDGHITEEWKKNLKCKGAEILGYVPNNAYLVGMNSSERAGVEALEEVRWVGGYDPEYKISPELSGPDGEGEEEIIVVLFAAKDSANVSTALEARGGTIHENSGELIRTTLDPDKIPGIAALREVKWIEKSVPAVLYNDVARNITGVSGINEEYNLTGKGQIVCVADSGLDTGVNDASMHPDIRGRILDIIDFSGDGAMDPDGHGTHVTGSVLGNGTASGGGVRGMAPEAELVFEAVGVNNSEYLSVPDNLTELIQPAYDNGTRIHTNSWGSDANGIYTIYSQYADQFMWDHPEMLILFSAGNSGTDSNGDGVVDLDSIGSPATAKNCISVGASENYRPEIVGTWGTYWPGDYPANPIAEDRVSDNIEGVAAFSSRGPTDDGRIKPDIVAPGTYIASTRSSLADSDGWGYINENYVYMGGTSMSTPITAGAAALVRQNYMDKLNTTPSAALIKATIINGAHNMSPGQYGTEGNREISGCPDFSQGWGRLDIGKTLYPAGERRIHFSDGLEIRGGESYENKYYINNSSESLKVTLVWTDYPADLPAEVTLVNDLDLYVTGPGDTQHTEADHNNNVEQVEIQNPEKGLYTVKVNGFNIPQGPQPFALVLSGATGEFPRLDMINITPAYSKIAVGGTIKLNVSTLDQYGNHFDADRTLSSSNTTVGTINDTTGVFTALKPGKTTITAESGEINETALVQVFEPPSFSGECPLDGSYLNNNVAKVSVNITEGNEGISPASINMTINGLPVEVNAIRIASGYRVEELEVREYPEGMTRISVNITDNSTYLTTHSWSFVVDTIPPTSTTPGDARFSANSTANFTGWKLFDINPGYYRVLRDGKQLTPFMQWENSTKISVPVDTDIGLGAFNYSIQYNDSANNYGTQDTVIITINDTTPPIININSPLEGDSTGSDSITVYGTVDGTGTLPSVTVNDVPAETLLDGFSGTFTKTVPLSIGVNTIYANATDAAGNADSVSVNVTRKEPRSPSGGKSSGGGGGGGSPEPASNVQAKELAQQFVTNGNHISFTFTHGATSVAYVEFEARRTAGKTTTIVEELKGKSFLTPTEPEGEVYRHLNIWVGNEGFATQENIANATVGFRVNKTWIAEKEIDPNSISFQHFSDEQWNSLPTSKVMQDEEYIYLEAKTPGFSPFAITGNANEVEVTQKMEILPTPENDLKHDKASTKNSEEIDSEMEKNNENPVEEKKIPAPGTGTFLMLLACACLVMKKKN